MTQGSANINTRSMRVDSELNICHERGDISGKLRRELWSLHTRDRETGKVMGLKNTSLPFDEHARCLQFRCVQELPARRRSILPLRPPSTKAPAQALARCHAASAALSPHRRRRPWPRQGQYQFAEWPDRWRLRRRLPRSADAERQADGPEPAPAITTSPITPAAATAISSATASWRCAISARPPIWVTRRRSSTLPNC